MTYRSGHGRIYIDKHGELKHEYVERVTDSVPKIWRQLAAMGLNEMRKQKNRKRGNG